MTAMGTWTGSEAIEAGKTLLLEASAGTGKTWQIEALVVRLVAEYGIPIERILVITFTNAATAELRKRVRTRLVDARDALAGSTYAGSDPIIAALHGVAEERKRRWQRVAAAVSTFDPVSYTHLRAHET